ncbi:MAG: hypothetical protein ACYCXB_06865, partial [Candidatus Humimicrobiaceae bacterium]
MNLLIPYVNIIDHQDPLLKEFTYGNIGQGGAKLNNTLSNGDYIFFHTSLNNKKYITAYYVVDRVLKTEEAVKDKRILAKFKNPHIPEFLNGNIHKDDYIVFGDNIFSKVFDRPLPFNKELASKLSLNIKFT